MSTLAQLQREFLTEVWSADSPSRAGMAIYRRTLLANLHGALASTYPVVRRLVGEAFFREAAARYARAHPSTSGDLNGHGREFASFLAVYPPARELAYLADVARLEWACHESFHAADAPRLDRAALARVSAEHHGAIRFQLHPAVRLVASPHPVLSIWEANQPERDGTPEKTIGAEQVLVRREALEVRLSLLAAQPWRFASSLARGETLDEAIDAAACDAVEWLAPLLQRFAADGVLCGFSAPGADA
jgi:hypothetical protein